MVVCWTSSDDEQHRDASNESADYREREAEYDDDDEAMDVQRAKKCKLWPSAGGDREEPPEMPPPPPRPPSLRTSKHADPCPQLQPFFHQVGGHTQFLQLDESTVCKPLIPRELSFYLNAPPEIRTFTPQWKGVIQTWQEEGRQYWRRFATSEISVAAQIPDVSSNHRHRHDAPLRISLAGHEAISRHPAHTYTDGSSQFFLMLENVASKFERPCVLDLKMGTRQHGDDASAEKRNRQMAKCAASTSASLGIRLCGMQVYQATSDSFWSQDKYFGRRLDADGLRRALVQFFASGGSRRGHVIEAILDRLRLLRKAVEQQETFRFYSSSLLIVYEGCEESCESFLSRDCRFFGPAERSSSDCGLDAGEQPRHGHGYQPFRSSSDAQISKKKQLDMDSLSITDVSSDCYLTDDTQSFSTSPQSVDSGLECLADNSSSNCCWSGPKRLKRFSRAPLAGECDNSTDSTDSGVFSSFVPKGFAKRSCATDSEDSESDADVARGQQEDDGELTPVLESREFDGQQQQQQQKKRRVDRSWADCVDVRMIDFAHTTFSGYLGLDERVHWGPDNGYLLGLDSLTGILSELRGPAAVVGAS